MPIRLFAGLPNPEEPAEEGEGPVVVCLVGDKRKSGQGEAFARAIGIAGGTIEPTEDTKGLLAGVGLVDVVVQQSKQHRGAKGMPIFLAFLEQSTQEAGFRQEPVDASFAVVKQSAQEVGLDIEVTLIAAPKEAPR